MNYKWYRNGVAFGSDGNISGATGPVLPIAKAKTTNQGSHHCAATEASETLNSCPHQLRVRFAQQLGQWNFNANVTDSASTNHGTIFGTPTYSSGKIGQLDSTANLLSAWEFFCRSTDSRSE